MKILILKGLKICCKTENCKASLKFSNLPFQNNPCSNPHNVCVRCFYSMILAALESSFCYTEKMLENINSEITPNL